MKTKTSIVICLGSSCYRRGNQYILEVVKSYIQEHNLKSEVEFKGQLCSGNCAHGPVIKINGEMFSTIDEASIIRILDAHFSTLSQEEV